MRKTWPFLFFWVFILTAGATSMAASQAVRFPVYLEIRSVDFYESIKFESVDGRSIEKVADHAVSAIVCTNRRNDEFSAEVSQTFLKEFLKILRRNGVEAVSSSKGEFKASSVTIKMAYEIQSQTFSVYLSLKEATHLVLAGTTVAVYTISAGGAEVGAPTIVAKSLAKILAKDLAATLAVHIKKSFEIQV